MSNDKTYELLPNSPYSITCFREPGRFRLTLSDGDNFIIGGNEFKAFACWVLQQYCTTREMRVIVATRDLVLEEFGLLESPTSLISETLETFVNGLAKREQEELEHEVERRREERMEEMWARLHDATGAAKQDDEDDDE